jgi:thioredoxin-like negative regulator of GroEL
MELPSPTPDELELVKLDVEAEPQIAARYGIQSIPTVAVATQRHSEADMAPAPNQTTLDQHGAAASIEQWMETMCLRLNPQPAKRCACGQR